MAFDLKLFATVTASSNKNANTIYAYTSSTNTIAQIKASGFFDDIALRLVIGDIIQAKGSAGNPELLVVTAVSPAVTTAVLAVPAGSITADMLADGAVTSLKLGDGAVTLLKLATGVRPLMLTKHAGKHTDPVGASATVSFAAPGVLAIHNLQAFIQSSANPVSIQKVTPTTDTVTILCSGAPGACVIAWNADDAAS